ncbi:MAG: MFS transporter [Clostridia bacterium]|nr:MFS transporter [Clostridia bacterium]
MFRIGKDPKANRLFFLCALAYFSSYLMRYDYGAALSEILSAENIAKSDGGLVSTSLFVAYGLGQIVSGVLGDKIKPYKLIFFGLSLTALINILMPFAPNYVVMIVLWGINGFAQAMLWPPLVRLMAENFDRNEYRKAVVNISMACAAATISVYLLAPLCIRISGWRLLFFVDGGIGALVAAVWILYVPGRQIWKGLQDAGQKEETEKPETLPAPDTHVPLARVFAITGIYPIMAAILAQGTIRDGVTTWTPRMMAEVFRIENADSILITVLLPILTVISLKVSEAINRRFFRNEVNCAILLFGVSFTASLLLWFFGDVNVILTVVLAGIAVSAIHGVNLMLICEVPGRFGRYGRISTVSGLLNMFTYVGSAASTYGFALIVEAADWKTLIFAWVLIDGIGILTLLLSARRWKNFISKTE